jgi:O-antigen ligase
MSPLIATFLFLVAIILLFRVDRDPRIKSVKTLLVPLVWFLIASSRAPSMWFLSTTMDASADMYVDGNPMERNIFLGLIICAVLILIQRRQRVLRALKSNAPLMLFIGYCLVSLLWADYPGVGFRRWIKLVGDLCMVLVVLTEADPEAAFDRLITWTGFIIVPISILLIRYFPNYGRSYEPWSGMSHWTGVTTNKNTLGLICMIVGLHSLWRFLRAWRAKEKRRRNRVLCIYGIQLALVAYLLKETDSATAKSCLVLGSIIIGAIVLFRAFRRPIAVHLLTACLLGVASFAAFFNFAGLLTSVGRKADLTGRKELWSIVLSQPVSHIVGAGYESFWVGDRLVNIQKSNSGQFANQSHNGYIEILVNLGWFGIFFLAFMIISGYLKISKAIQVNAAASSLRLAYFVAMIACNFTEASFKMMDPIWICFVWAVVAPPGMVKVKQAKPRKVESEDLIVAGAYVSKGLPEPLR